MKLEETDRRYLSNCLTIYSKKSFVGKQSVFFPISSFLCPFSLSYPSRCGEAIEQRSKVDRRMILIEWEKRTEGRRQARKRQTTDGRTKIRPTGHSNIRVQHALSVWRAKQWIEYLKGGSMDQNEGYNQELWFLWIINNSLGLRISPALIMTTASPETNY